jgi:hydrogenase maturation protease
MHIICCGNRDRGDDAAGLLVAERLEAFGIPVVVCPGGALELIEAWTGASDVLVIDAVVTGAAPGTVQPWDGLEAEIPQRPPASTHGLGVGEAIALARILGRLPARLRVYGIEAAQFQPGTEASPQVREAAENLAAQVAAELVCQQA